MGRICYVTSDIVSDQKHAEKSDGSTSPISSVSIYSKIYLETSVMRNHKSMGRLETSNLFLNRLKIFQI